MLTSLKQKCSGVSKSVLQHTSGTGFGTCPLSTADLVGAVGAHCFPLQTWWALREPTAFLLIHFSVFFQVIGLLDVFTPARSLEEFNDV